MDASVSHASSDAWSCCLSRATHAPGLQGCLLFGWAACAQLHSPTCQLYTCIILNPKKPFCEISYLFLILISAQVLQQGVHGAAATDHRGAQGAGPRRRGGGSLSPLHALWAPSPTACPLPGSGSQARQSLVSAGSPAAACCAGPQRSASLHPFHHHTRIICLRTRNERAPARLGCVGHCGSLKRPCCPPLPTPAMAPEHGRCRMNPCCFLACKQPVLQCPCEQYEQTGGQKAPRLLSCFR